MTPQACEYVNGVDKQVNCRMFWFALKVNLSLYTRYCQGYSDGGYISIYTPKISLPNNFLCAWLLVVVFFCLTHDKFDIVPVCVLARVSFTYLHATIYTPQMKLLATRLARPTVIRFRRN